MNLELFLGLIFERTFCSRIPSLKNRTLSILFNFFAIITHQSTLHTQNKLNFYKWKFCKINSLHYHFMKWHCLYSYSQTKEWRQDHQAIYGIHIFKIMQKNGAALILKTAPHICNIIPRRTLRKCWEVKHTALTHCS